MGRGEKGSCGQERGQGSFREDGGQRFPGWGGGCVLRVAARGGGVVENLSSPSPSPATALFHSGPASTGKRGPASSTPLKARTYVSAQRSPDSV